MAFSKFLGSFESTNFVVMPSCGKMVSNWVYVPPYRLLAETISSPAWARVMME